MYNGRMTKKEKIIDGLRNIVIDRYIAEGKVLTSDDGNNIWYSLLGVYERDGYDKAKEYCKFVVAKMKAIPVCPHIYFTQFLDDNNELERQLGMDFGLRLLSECNKVIVFDDDGISEGMKKEIELANRLNIPVGYWSSGVYGLL